MWQWLYKQSKLHEEEISTDKNDKKWMKTVELVQQWYCCWVARSQSSIFFNRACEPTRSSDSHDFQSHDL